MNSDVPKREILVVDDSKVVRWTAKKILQSDYTIHEAASGLEGWEVLQQNPNIAAVFSDLQMEGSDGYELLALIRGSDDPHLLNLPVIIITGNDDGDSTKRKVLNLGATDFIVKPFDAVTLKNRADAYIGYCQKLAEVEEKSERDRLTGLANRQSYFIHGDQDLSLAVRHKTELAVALLEVNHFMDLLNQYGKKSAAHILVKLSQAIVTTLRREDISARIGTARFALILPLTNRVGSLRSIERLCEEIDSLAINVSGQPLDLRISAGVAILNLEQPCATFAQLVGEAKEALNSAIAAGGGVVTNIVPLAAEVENVVPITAAEAPSESQGTRRATDQQPSLDIIQAIAKIEAGAGDSINADQLSQLMRAVMPLLSHANKELDLGMTAVLEAASEKL
ncbi:MAG: diguanylate cyclase [Candidatus Polarisedimenticolaceae bacterium]|nr:diguanylate cyclase [Candidatus Polarisedimenticolaceae bacterium]